MNRCIYCTPNDFNTISSSTKNSKLNVLQLNIHSLPSKLCQLKNLLSDLKSSSIEIDLVMLCETFINDNNADLCAIPGYTFLESHRQNKSRGGVAIYVNNKFTFKLRKDLDIFDECFFESKFIELTSTKKHVIVGEIYRIPNTNEKEFIDKYSQILQKVSDENKDIIFGMDQNLDFLKFAQHTNTSDFLNLNYSFGLLPTISRPTRITHSTATLIDNIFVKSQTACNSKSVILVSQISDHLPCLVMLDCENKHISGPIEFQSRKLNSAKVDKIVSDLETIDWNILENLNPNEGYNKFQEILTTVLDKYAPIKTVVIPVKYQIREPWMTPGLLKSSIECDKKYKEVIGLPHDSPEFLEYKRYRNLYNQMKRYTKINHYKSKVNEYINDSYKLWSTLKEIINKTKNKSDLSDVFLINGVPSNNLKDISNGFCQYFSNVGPELASKIPASTKPFSSYLGGNHQQSLFLAPTDVNEIKKIIGSIKPKNSTGHDMVSNNFIKQISNVIAIPLCNLINKSMSHGVFPDTLKLAKVVPIYKSKEKFLFSNHRPISVLPSISKIFEKVIYKRLYGYLSINGILHTRQYGFRNGHSTINAITDLCYHILQGFDNKNITLAVFLDLSKAFDTVDHEILLKKLEHYGIRGLALEWFKSYLSDRKQYVEIKSTKSNISSVQCGVPQGSVLGPLLFIIYMNDLSNALDRCKDILFADDTTLHMSGNDKRQLFLDMENELSLLTDWFHANKLSINYKKTNYIIFSPKHFQDIDMDVEVTLKFGNEELEEKQFTKFLGMFIDKHLNWTNHFNHLISKLSRAIYTINMVKNFLPKECLKTLYYALYYSHLTYGISLWGTTMVASLKNKIFTSQKKIARILNLAAYNAPSNPIFKQLKLLKLEDIIEMELLKLMYQVMHNQAPISICNLFPINANIHNYNTRRRYDPVIRSRNYAPLDHSFVCLGPSLWSSQPNDIKNSTTVKTLSRRIRKLTVSRY